VIFTKSKKKINVRYKYWLTQVVCAAYLALFLWLASSDDASNKIFGSYFSVVMLVAMLYRDQIVIVNDSEQIYRFRGVLIFGQKKEFCLKTVNKVSLVKKIYSHRGESRLGYVVQLVSNKKDDLYAHPKLLHTRAVAEKVAAAIKKDLENRVFGRGALRKYDELDQPLISYASIKSEVDRVNDRISLTVSDTANKRRIAFSQNTRGDREILYWMMGCLIFLMLFFPPLIVLFIVVSPIFLYLLLSFHGKTKILISNKFLKIRRGLNPLSQRIKLSELEEMIIGKGCLYFLGDKKYFGVCVDGSHADLKQIKMLIVEKLAQFNSHYTIDSANSLTET